MPSCWAARGVYPPTHPPTPKKGCVMGRTLVSVIDWPTLRDGGGSSQAGAFSLPPLC